MTQTAIQIDAFDQTYRDVENLINKIVWKFQHKYGGTFDEWKGEANFIFAKAFNRYVEGSGTFITYLYICLQGQLNNFRARNTKQNQTISTEVLSNDEGAFDLQDVHNPSSSFIDLVDEIKSEDARTVLNLVLDMPEELKNTKMAGGSSPKHMKLFLKTYLQKIGWTARRATESFQEIGDALYA